MVGKIKANGVPLKPTAPSNIPPFISNMARRIPAKCMQLQWINLKTVLVC